MYPPGATTYVEVRAAAEPLEGRFRPGHFRGVATIVLKLFNLIQPDVACFGRKDYQQSLVIRRMACDLDLPLRMLVCPTVREADGLAMSCAQPVPRTCRSPAGSGHLAQSAAGR